MLKAPVINPMLVLLVYRAMVRCGGRPELSRGWGACPGWGPQDERQAEVYPLEWASRLPAASREQLVKSLESDFFQTASGLRSSDRDPTHGPAELAAILYEDAPGGHDFSQAPNKSSSGPVLATGRPWRGNDCDVDWIINARPASDAWLELEPSQHWDAHLPRLCLRLGAGLWFHPPSRKLSSPEKCDAFCGALDAILDTPGWDQWVFPLCEALEFGIASHLSSDRAGQWSAHPRAAKWPTLPEWAWEHANSMYEGSFGCLCATIALELTKRFDFKPLGGQP